MKQLILVLSISMAFLAIGEVTAPTTSENKLTAEERAAILKKVQIAKGGDKIAKPGTQRGKITIVNAQSRANKEWIAAAVDYLERDTCFKIELKDGTFDPAGLKSSAAMTIYVVDDPQLPKVVVAPDDCWGYCNIASLYTEEAPFFEARTKKMVSRTFAMLCGGMSSAYTISLAGPMPKVSDLDVLPNEHLPVDVTIRMTGYMEKFGVTPALLKPYKVACQEGWAPAPTNEVQQAIWDRIKAEQAQIPTKPMRITPEMKPQGK